MNKEIERPATPETNLKTTKPLGFSLAEFGVLTQWASNRSIRLHASAQSEARIGVRPYSKAYSRIQRFFCTDFSLPFRFMAGLLGASSDAPVTFEAGYANPDNSASSIEIGVSYGGSILKGAIQHG